MIIIGGPSRLRIRKLTNRGCGKAASGACLRPADESPPSQMSSRSGARPNEHVDRRPGADRRSFTAERNHLLAAGLEMEAEKAPCGDENGS